MKKRTKRIAIASVAAVAIGAWILSPKADKNPITYETAAVARTTVAQTITATGKIEPVTEVAVGTQVSGIVDRLYVDYNSPVTKGQLIAEMDKITLTNDLQSAQANYNGSKAQYEFQEKTWNRNKALHAKQLISDVDFEQSEFNYLNAKSNYEHSRATLAKAQRNLSYATIYSPIDGVVINRVVEEGQTVAAGFNTPTLFNIAADLTQMRVIADVDEADIGGVVEGLKATFTVDAYPDEVFEGTVVQVRLGKDTSSGTTTSSSVVTYEVVINAPNPDLKLKPRLTADVTVCKQEKTNALAVPTRALRFSPTPEVVGGKAVVNDIDAPSKVWTRQDNVFTAHAVQTGLAGNTYTEVSGIDEGTEVVVSAKENKTQGGRVTFSPH